MTSIGSPLLWTGFLAFILLMLALDLGFHRRSHVIGFGEALGWSGFWIALALVFNVGVWRWFGPQAGLEFLTGYLIEKSLSVDNVFVFAVLFSSFGVPAQYQHRVLFWGVLGALVMRAVFIFAGVALIGAFHWVIYLFGAILIGTGIRLLRRRDDEVHPERNPLFRLFQRLMPAVPDYHGRRFTLVQRGRRHATPLLLVLVAIEVTDLVFAVDSIPAIFAVTRDPFIIFTSNIFAILGLRALYFLLAGALRRLAYLHVGLAMVLVFVGVKMVIADLYKIPTPISLGVVTLLIAVGVVPSLLRTGPAPTSPRV
jgi:tellurite resistance protein TerC